jgi:hypothetical protein
MANLSTIFSPSWRAAPNLSLDFLGATLSPLVSLSRSLNTATLVNVSGLIEDVNADIARFDYDPITKACRGLLIEETRQNIQLQSEDFSTTWARTNLNVTTNTTVSPDGSQTADTLTASASPGNIAYLQSVTNGTTYAFSLFVKKLTSDTVQINFSNVAAGPIFTFSTESFSTVSGWTTFIQKFDSGWYRISAARASNTTFAGMQIRIATSGEAVAAWGAQMEVGAFVTSYIPTTTVAVTRNADVATIAGTNFSGFWRAGKGSALVRARPSTVSGIRPLIQFDDATADNIIALRGNTTNPELYVRAGGSDQVQIDAGTIAANTSYRLAGSWAENSCAASINSGTPVLDGVATIPVVTQSRLGSDGTNYLNGHLEAVEYYDERVLDASLQVVSSTAGYRSIIGPVFRDAIIS